MWTLLEFTSMAPQVLAAQWKSCPPALVARRVAWSLNTTCEWIVHRGDVNVKNPQIRFGPFQVAMCSPKYIDFMKNIQVNCWCCCDNDLKFFTHQVTWATIREAVDIHVSFTERLYMLQTHLPIYLATIQISQNMVRKHGRFVVKPHFVPSGKRLHNYGKIHHAM